MGNLDEANLVDLSNDEVKDAITYYYESIKKLEEEKKVDPDIQQLRDQLKQLQDDRYNDEIKTCKAKLKALRAQAKVRGIKFKLPGD